MSEAKHTDGPWHATRKFTFVSDAFSQVIASIEGQNKGNALLIASSTELLEGARCFIAYEDAMARCDDVAAMLHYADASKKLREAIAKAEGRS